MTRLVRLTAPKGFDCFVDPKAVNSISPAGEEKIEHGDKVETHSNSSITCYGGYVTVRGTPTEVHDALFKIQS